jgi:eukaryotic-like serine/threonine-protein kinase
MTGPREACTIRFGKFELNMQSGELRKGRTRIRLQEQPLRVLIALLNRPGEVVSREELRQELWPSDTFVDFEHGLRVAVNKLRQALSDDSDKPRYVETLPRRGYRFMVPITVTPPIPSEEHANFTQGSTEPVRHAIQLRQVAVLAASIALLCVALSTWWFVLRPKHPLTDKDTIVLAAFTNTTGDPVFDGTLREALAVSLAQSPFLNILSDERMGETLRMMNRSPDEPVTLDLAREICQRTGSKALLAGSITSLGTGYVINLKAINCATGDSIAREELQTSRKDDVLDTLAKIGTRLRQKLGESLASIQKFDTPIAQATTSSLEALKAFTLAGKSGGMISDVPFLLHAIDLDPKFALAYAQLADSYFSAGEVEQASLYAQKAFDLSGRVTERERFQIVATYYYSTLGDLHKELSVYPIWEQMYPRDLGPWVNSADSRIELGDYPGALRDAQEALRLYPGRSPASVYGNLGAALLALNRGQEAKQLAQQAIANGLDISDMHILIYLVAFVDNDTKSMEAQLAPLLAKPEDNQFKALCVMSSTAAYFGRWRNASDHSARANRILERRHYSERAAQMLAGNAILEAEFGNLRDAKRDVVMAQSLSSGRKARLFIALALARTGDAVRARYLADQLNKQFPSDTILQGYWLPALRGSIELVRKDPMRAVEALQAVSYELGDRSISVGNTSVGNLYPAYLRGQAYLAARQGKPAVAEFQKFVDYRSIVLNSPLAALARLGLARAYLLQGDKPRARAAYQDFLTLWKGADPDIPILQQAKAEYAKLQ